VPGLRRSRAAGALRIIGAALAAAVLTSGSAWAAGPAVGPVQINPVGHPRLCWQAGGNGSGVTLERCDPAVAGQQWSLTGNGVVMNGNGYCLEAGQAAALYIDFAGQCAGAGPGNGRIGRGQVWQYRAGQLASAGTGACAGPGRPVAPGVPVVRRPCSPPGPAGSRWSIAVRAHAVVTGTSQRRGTPRTATASLKVPVRPAAPRPAAGIRFPLLTVAAVATALLLAGALLLFAARRRPRHASRRSTL